MEVQQIIMIVHVLIALAIIGLILLQQGKGADMGASFGAGSSQTMFGGAGGGNLLTRATAILSAAFFATSFGLAIVAKNIAQKSAIIDAPVAELLEEAPAVIESDESEVPVVETDSAPASDDTDIPGVD